MCMSVRNYLPSAQFLVIAGALLISGGAVAAAHYYTSSHEAPGGLASANTTAMADDAWEQSLAAIQAQSGVTLPDPPSADAVQDLLKQAQSSNLTDSIGRGLLVKLTNAGVQGLGSDIPTQDSIIAEAAAQINASHNDPKAVSLTTTEVSETSLRTYGNAVIAVFINHPTASMEATLVTIAKATDTHITEPLAALAPIGREYGAIADELAEVAVPKTLAPLHLQVVQNFYAIADSYAEMKLVVEDPLRGLTGLQKYQSLMAETGRVLTNIAEALNKGGILFGKDEPGSAWSNFLAP